MSAVLELEPDVRAPARARHWLTDACEGWGCPNFVPDAGLLVTELTTNAVLHAGTRCRVEADFDDLVLRVSVSDPMPGDLSLAASSSHGERGRGLMIVNALANVWGVSPTLTGKSVWFALWTPALSEPHTRAGRVGRGHLSLVPGDLPQSP